jgi:23S rRNA pseudouridine1911/1915/1917 synthase
MAEAHTRHSEEPGEEWLTFEAPNGPRGNRIDRLVANAIPEVGRKLAALLCEGGHVLVDGSRAKKSLVARPGQTIEVRISAWGEALPAPHLPLNVVLERDDVVIVSKDPGVPTSAILGREHDTLAGALLARYPEMKNVGYSRREPGVLHRLDTFTSGLLVAARRPEAFLALREELARGSWKKKYLALVETGTLRDHGIIEAALAPHPKNRQKVLVVEEDRSKAKSEFAVLQRGKTCDLVEVKISSAYRHQVRAHLAHLGAPLLGDTLYGGKTTRLTPRHALHASYVACSADGVPTFEVELPLPEDLAALFLE